MSLKENLLNELQKLRISREKPIIKQQKDWAKKSKDKQSKLMQTAKDLLAEVEESE